MSERSGGATSAGGDRDDSDLTSRRYETTGESTLGSSTTGRSSSDYETTDYGRRDRSVPVREEYVEPRERHTERNVVHRETQPVYRERDDDDRPVNVAVGAERKDAVRWGPIWAGLLTALTSFILLELLFYALGWLTLSVAGVGAPSSVVTGILALVAFLLGGLVAGATAMWKGIFSGILHGFLVWALGVVAFVALTFLGGSALLGSFGSLTNTLGVGPQEVQSTATVSPTEAEQVASEAKDDAAPAFWGLFLPLAASVIGGIIGTKMWPRRDDTDPETVRMRS